MCRLTLIRVLLRRYLILAACVGLMALPGCAAWDTGGDVWHGPRNLLHPNQGPINPQAAEIDRRLQRN